MSELGLELSERETIEAALFACEQMESRANVLDRRLRALLAPEHVTALRVRGLATMWNEPKLAALEALAALIPAEADEEVRSL